MILDLLTLCPKNEENCTHNTVLPQTIECAIIPKHKTAQP